MLKNKQCYVKELLKIFHLNDFAYYFVSRFKS